MLDLLESAGTQRIAIRVMHSMDMTGTAFVFQLVPLGKLDFKEYREFRRAYLGNYCLALAGKHKELSPVVGIATEPGIDNHGRSYDLVCVKIDDWTPELEAKAEETRREFGFLREGKIRRRHVHDTEYRPTPPAVVGSGRRRTVTKIARNAPCPCGSGRKYKRCCGRQSKSAGYQ